MGEGTDSRLVADSDGFYKVPDGLIKAAVTNADAGEPEGFVPRAPYYVTARDWVRNTIERIAVPERMGKFSTGGSLTFGGVPNLNADIADQSVTQDEVTYEIVERLARVAIAKTNYEHFRVPGGYGQYLTNRALNAANLDLNLNALVGDGTGTNTLGALSANNTALVTAPADASQTADTVSSSNLIALYTRLSPGHDPSRTVIVMAPVAYAYAINTLYVGQNPSVLSLVGGQLRFLGIYPVYPDINLGTDIGAANSVGMIDMSTMGYFYNPGADAVSARVVESVVKNQYDVVFRLEYDIQPMIKNKAGEVSGQIGLAERA